MKKSLLLAIFLLLTVLTATMVSAGLSYTGNNYANPATVKSLEFVTDNTLGPYYVYAVQNGNYERFCYSDEDKTQIGCNNVNFLNGSDISYDSAGNQYLFTSRNADSPNINLASLIGATSGVFQVTGISNLTAMGQNWESYALVYANNTEFNAGADTNLPFTNISAIDYYDNTTIIALAGNNNRTVYSFYLNGTLRSQDTISGLDVPVTPIDIYAYNDTVYIVTPTRNYEFLLTKYSYIDGTYYSATQCVDEFNLCSNTQIVENPLDVEFWCDLDNVTRCDGVCNTVIGYDAIEQISYNTGECFSTGCTNECSFNMQQECTAYSQYRRCGNYDSDPCLEWGVETSCLPNQYCNTGYCDEINYTTSGSTTNYPSFYVIGEITNDEDTSMIKEATNEVSINTKNNIHIQGFKSLTSDPSTPLNTAIDCYYRETVNQPVQKEKTLENNTNNTFTYVSSSTKYKNELNISMNEVTGGLIVTLFDESQGNIIQLLYTINNSENRISLCEYNGTNCTFDIFDRDNLGSSLDIDNLQVLIYTDMAGQYYQVKTEINTILGDRTTYTSINRNFVNAIDYANKLKINNSLDKNITLNLLSTISLPTQMPFFKDYDRNTYEIQCTYDTKGCQIARFYGIGNNISSYLNYVDYKVCLNSVSSSEAQQEGNTFLDNFRAWSTVAKLLILLVIMSIITYIFTFTSEAQDFIALKYTGLFFNIIIVITAIALEIIDPFIIILAVVITAAIGAVLFRKTVFGE